MQPQSHRATEPQSHRAVSLFFASRRIWMRSATDSCCRSSPPEAMARDVGPSNCALSPCKTNHAPFLRHFGEAGPYRRRRRAWAR